MTIESLPCVAHVVAARDGAAMQTLERTREALAGVGIDQAVIETDAPGAGPFGRARALKERIDAVARRRSVYAVHLHGLEACLLGARALKGGPLQGRVLYSPHLAHPLSAWTAALVGRLLQSQLEPLDCAIVAASLTEAQTLSRLFKRSADVLPHPVAEVFFLQPRLAGPAPHVLADGTGAQAVDMVSSLCVLLNGREPRVPIAWLGDAGGAVRAQLEAAGVQVLGATSDAARARALSRATAFIHVAPEGRAPLAAAQAMAAGVPCLVSDTALHRSLVRHGETGLVCASRRDFLEKLVILLRNGAERERIGVAARSEAERSFTLRHFQAAILRAYGFQALPTGKSERLRPAVHAA